MNRLTGIEYYDNSVHQSDEDISIDYFQDGYGNMSSKSDVGDFTYGETMDYNSTSYTSGPHALTSIDNLEGYLPKDQEITYTQFNKVFADTRDANAAYTKYFFGDYEEKHMGGEVTKYYFIHSPVGLCAIYAVDSESSDSILWHVFTDHLGSPSVLIDADSAENKLEYSFTSWGIPRDPTDWSQSATTSLLADRGFTGHEHLTEFGLINMNGRVYDPVIGRFLSPDPYVQMPGIRSGYNRYSYCLNNPLVYTDPSGEIVATIFTFTFDLLRTALLNGGLDPTSKEARQNAWREFDPSAPRSNTNMAWQTEKHLLGKAIRNPGEFIWTLPQNLFGYTWATINLSVNNVERISEFEGTMGYSAKTGHHERGAAMGSFIFGYDLITNYRDHRFVHEYGHYLQSKRWGWFWLPIIGFPSLTSAITTDSYTHGDMWYERNAN